MTAFEPYGDWMLLAHGFLRWEGGCDTVFIQRSLRVAPCLLTAWGKLVHKVCSWFAVCVEIQNQ